MEHNANDMPFAADLSVIDIAAWLRIRESDWEAHIEFDQLDTEFLIEEDAA